MSSFSLKIFCMCIRSTTKKRDQRTHYIFTKKYVQRDWLVNIARAKLILPCYRVACLAFCGRWCRAREISRALLKIRTSRGPLTYSQLLVIALFVTVWTFLVSNVPSGKSSSWKRNDRSAFTRVTSTMLLQLVGLYDTCLRAVCWRLPRSVHVHIFSSIFLVDRAQWRTSIFQRVQRKRCIKFWSVHRAA